MTLDEQLQALRQQDRHLAVPGRVEAAVLEAFDATGPGRVGTSRRAGMRINGAGVLALAAGIILGAGATFLYFQRQAPPTVPAQQVGESVVFVMEPPAVEETVRIVRIRVARSALESLGIQTVAAQEGDTVEVDVLVGDDGVARGVRLAM